jgi:hypothetical protein
VDEYNILCQLSQVVYLIYTNCALNFCIFMLEYYDFFFLFNDPLVYCRKKCFQIWLFFCNFIFEWNMQNIILSLLVRYRCCIFLVFFFKIFVKDLVLPVSIFAQFSCIKTYILSSFKINNRSGCRINSVNLVRMVADDKSFSSLF